MKILTLDTAMAACSVAVHQSAEILAQDYIAMERGHAEKIALMVRDVAAKAGMKFSDLDRIAVTLGPGTFTGVRIGLAMARGLGLALGIPVIGFDTLSAIAANEKPGDMPLLVAADARRDELYSAMFSASGEMLRTSAVLTVEACLQLLPEGPVRLLGTGAERLMAASLRTDLIRSPAGDLPDAANFGRLVFGLPAPKGMPVPLYLRAPDAKPQNTIAIEAATPGAAEIFAALHEECFDNPWSCEEFSQLMSLPGTLSSLALQAGEPVGFLLARCAADEAEILTLGTRSNARRRGIAKALLNHQLTDLRRRNIKSCFIEVAADNGAACALYQGFGFSKAGVRSAYYERQGPRFADALVLRKEFGP
ncbi:MAG TPA: tRNA (adenosine(37)-N6)-threonylcarbamoyltransferase complex dimerization subunit type 1 TsaB [Aestuariivirga sp.]|nr:tRNA (adenosine(37)-N6)-threonylcarbamoyltransferase complex dimerization subunit type 1 TsaB [Aestuariivirga sp.]